MYPDICPYRYSSCVIRTSGNVFIDPHRAWYVCHQSSSCLSRTGVHGFGPSSWGIRTRVYVVMDPHRAWYVPVAMSLVILIVRDTYQGLCRYPVMDPHLVWYVPGSMSSIMIVLDTYRYMVLDPHRAWYIPGSTSSWMLIMCNTYQGLCRCGSSSCVIRTRVYVVMERHRV
jgi:hypothetical protein